MHAVNILTGYTLGFGDTSDLHNVSQLVRDPYHRHDVTGPVLWLARS